MLVSTKLKTGLVLASLLAFAGSLLTAASAEAQLVVRAIVTIKDSTNDKPIENAKVVLSFKETNYSETRTTNKKGQITFTLQNGPVDYAVVIEAEGYNPATSSIRPVTGQVSNTTFKLDPLNAPAAAPVADPNAKLTPAQETFNAGVLLLQEGDLAGAQGKFEESLRLDPALLAADSAIAGIEIENKEFASAEARARKVVAADARNPRGQRLLYEALRGQGKADEAKEVLAVLVDLEKGAGDVTAMIYNEGTEALRLGDAKTARERFEKALELKPDLQQARSALMVLYIKGKEYQKAAESAEFVLATKPEDVTAKRIRYDAYRGLGDAAKTKEAFDALAAADPKVLIKGLYEDAQKAFNANDAQGALAILDQIDQIDPNVAKAHYLRGLAFLNVGKNAQAKAALQKFLALAPNDPQAKGAKDIIADLK